MPIILIPLLAGLAGMLVYTAAVFWFAARHFSTEASPVKAAYYKGPKWLRVLFWSSWAGAATTLLLGGIVAIFS